MRKSSIPLLACLVCLILASTLSAQDEVTVVSTEKVVRLYSSNLPPEVDLQAYLNSGQVMLTNGVACEQPKIVVGPAPAPYPQAVIWEKGIEQLGPTSIKCDGMWFINGNLWQPHKIALVMWKIRIPQPSKRLASEFARDLTLSMWVDGNEDKTWGMNERIINESFNINQFFPNNWNCLEIWYLSCFQVPTATTMGQLCGGGAIKYETKLWVRGGLSYDDVDVSPVGQWLFGEVEDYQINYFEIQYPSKKKG
jgi:hypothetical protein